MNWYRVPAWIGGRLCGDHVATDREAWVDLLGRWHAGEDVSVNDFRRACAWGQGRTLKFIPAVARWAVDVGATVPDHWRDHVAKSSGPETDRLSDRKRTTENKEEPMESGSTGPQTDRFRTASRARALPVEVDETESVGVGTATAPAVETPPDLPMLLQGDHATLAALVACRVLTVDDLTKLTMGRLRSIRGIGPKRALTIREALVAHGLDLVTEDLPPARRTVERPGQRNLSDRWCAAFTASTGQAYRWTAKGRTSDQAAVATLYDVVGWSAEPSEAVVADAGGTVRRYLGECKRLGQVPTLTHMVAQLPRWRQTVDQRAGPVDRRASIFEQMLAANDNTAPSRIVIDIPTTEAAK